MLRPQITDSVIDAVDLITKVHTITSTAIALGYSMCTRTLWTLYAADQLKVDHDKDRDEHSLFGWLFVKMKLIAVIADTEKSVIFCRRQSNTQK